MRTFSLLLILLTLTLSSCGQKDKKVIEEKSAPQKLDIPAKPIGWVSDFEKVLTQQQINYLDSIIALHEKETTNQIAIVTYELDSTVIKSAEDFDKFSLSLFNQWGIGTKEKNNGVGILISKNVKRIRIEIGKGLETKLTNGESKTIIDTIIIPEFKKGDYFTGISRGLNAIIEKIK